MSAVLIVEDEAGLREGLAGAVQTLGHRAMAAAGLGEARRLLQSESVDCVLLDIRLRDGDGLDLLREIRAGRWRDIPVMVTYHPSYLLRAYNQAAKREAWEDLKKLIHFVYD